MRIVVQTGIPDDPILCRQWNELVRQMERPEVFYACEWASAVQSAYQGSLTPLLFLGYEGDRLTGVAALGTDARPQVFFLAGATADYCDFVVRPAHHAAFVESVLGELQSMGIGKLALANLPADSPTASLLRSRRHPAEFRLFSRPAYLCAQVALGSCEQREQLKQALNQRKILRYSLRAMAKQASVSLEHLRTWESVEPALSDFFEAHVARFAVSGRASNLAQPERRQFLYELAKSLCCQGWFEMTRLMVGDRPVAWNYGFRFAGSWFYYQPTFVSSVRRLSPGACLLSKLIEHACDDPEIQLVDLGLGAEGYKERFANQLRSTVHVAGSTSAVQNLKERARYYAASGIKSLPPLEHSVRAVLGGAQSLGRFFQAKRERLAQNRV